MSWAKDILSNGLKEQEQLLSYDENRLRDRLEAVEQIKMAIADRKSRINQIKDAIEKVA